MWRWLIALVVTVTMVATSVFAYEWAHRPKSLAAAEQAWRQAGIENYTLDVAVDDCMACGEPLKYTVVVTNGEKTSETDPPGWKPGYAPAVEDLFRTLEVVGPEGSTATYNGVGVPIEIRVDAADVADDEARYTVTFTET
jgi:Family of unknown function (DUF6174)